MTVFDSVNQAIAEGGVWSHYRVMFHESLLDYFSDLSMASHDYIPDVDPNSKFTSLSFPESRLHIGTVLDISSCLAVFRCTVRRQILPSLG